LRPPLKWARGLLTFKDAAGAVKTNDLIFTCSLSDFYHEDADPWREEAFQIIEDTPFQYLILTKRPERIIPWHGSQVLYGDRRISLRRPMPSNVWLGVSISDTKGLWRLDELTKIPAAIRWISFEPLISKIFFNDYDLKLLNTGIKWVVTGGERGSGCRPFVPQNALEIIEFCELMGIACFHKQNGGTKKIGGTWGGDKLHGKTFKDYPEFKPVHPLREWYQDKLF